MPPEGTVERWAWDFVLTRSLSHKLTPPPIPSRWEDEPHARRLTLPGRPPELEIVSKAPKKRGLATESGRARAVHTFLHHELQAAELMAWAILAFPFAPKAFRHGLARIALDEIRHMRLYEDHLKNVGYGFGSFAVRDWFWERVPACQNEPSFVAVMGLGFEGANLEHTASFASRFRAVGDEEGARIQERVGHEEMAHVRFGAHWFGVFAGGLTFDRWRHALPSPLSPMLMRGQPLARTARSRAGMPAEFLDRLDAWTPVAPGF